MATNDEKVLDQLHQIKVALIAAKLALPDDWEGVPMADVVADEWPDNPTEDQTLVGFTAIHGAIMNCYWLMKKFPPPAQ